MTEAEARDWIALRFGEDAVERLETLRDLVLAENRQQNLVAPSTTDTMWTRHIVDSAQLVTFGLPGRWIDVGTGGGFPGLVVALLRDETVLLVEPRRRRADFLRNCVERLGLANAEVVQLPIERIARPAENISARAVASIDKLLQIAAGCGIIGTRWLLPRGKLGERDRLLMAQARLGMFHVEQSVTDSLSSIVILDQTAPI